MGRDTSLHGLGRPHEARLRIIEGDADEEMTQATVTDVS